MSPTLAATINSLVLPPGIFLILFFIAIYMFFKKNKAFIYMIVTTVVLIYMFSTPIFSRYLSSMVETDSALDIAQLKNNMAEAIVVLGCSRYSNAPEFNKADSVSACTLVRLRYAAILHKATKLPILVSGGSVYDEQIAEAEMMQGVLIDEFGINVQWVEAKSRNTMENAKQAAELLKTDNINKMILVTHAIHMPRAKYAFSKFGLDILPAPTNYYSTKDGKPNYFDFLPSAYAFYISHMALHEMVGYLWLKLR